MNKTTSQLKEIIQSGGVIKLNIKSRTYKQIIDLANTASKGQGGLVFTDAEQRTTKQLIEIASYNIHKNIQLEIKSKRDSTDIS